MSARYFTFWSLLTAPSSVTSTTPFIQYLHIPLIQRDYAQGRDDAQAAEVRQRLLNALYRALDQEQSLTLDFVYGELDPIGRFVPLDGQQRLTTLFLLHWYLALQAGRLSEPAVQAALGKFSYDTRSSAREFCQQLVARPPNGWQDYDKVSDALRDQPWYQPAWGQKPDPLGYPAAHGQDPTVAAMLTMIDALHAQFGHRLGWFELLTDPAHPIIGFYLLDMREVGLTDDLYLKMNARGRPLSPFENRKAAFDLHLQQQGWPALQQEFGRKADNEWTDIFWQPGQLGAYAVDTDFGRCLDFLTRMLAYQRDHPSRKTEIEAAKALAAGPLDFAHYEQVYTTPQPVRQLFNILDFLATQQQQEGGMAGLLTRLFSKKPDAERVRLFGQSPLNIFGRVLAESRPDELLQEQVLLYGLLTYGATQQAAKQSFVETDACNLLRVLRNLLEQARYRDGTRTGSSLTVSDLPSFARTCTALAATAGSSSPDVYTRLVVPEMLPKIPRSVVHECRKAELLRQHRNLAPALHELENQDVFRGMLFNLRPDENANELPVFSLAVREIWGVGLEQHLIIRAWLAVGAYAVELGWSQLGHKYFFGNSKNWRTLLTHGDDNLGTALRNFLRAYVTAPGSNATDKLKSLIQAGLSRYQDYSQWEYYFLQYPEMTEGEPAFYAWHSNFELRLLRSTDLRGKHINPYVLTVLRRGQVAAAVVPEDEHWVNNNDSGPLWLHNIPGVYSPAWLALHCLDEGWRLSLPPDHTLPSGLEDDFALRPDPAGSTWWLPATAGYDRIEHAEAFIAALHTHGTIYTEPTSTVAHELGLN